MPFFKEVLNNLRREVCNVITFLSYSLYIKPPKTVLG